MLSDMPWNGSVWSNDDHQLVFLGTDAVLVYILVGLVSQNKTIKSNFTQRRELWLHSLEFAKLFWLQQRSPAVSSDWILLSLSQSFTEVKVSVSHRWKVKSVSWEESPLYPAMEEQWKSQPYNGTDLRTTIYLYNFFSSTKFTYQIYRSRMEQLILNHLCWQVSSISADSVVKCGRAHIFPMSGMNRFFSSLRTCFNIILCERELLFSLFPSDKFKLRPSCIVSHSDPVVFPGCHILFAHVKAQVPQLLLSKCPEISLCLCVCVCGLWW